jgi:hypothetical protein
MKNALSVRHKWNILPLVCTDPVYILERSLETVEFDLLLQ